MPNTAASWGLQFLVAILRSGDFGAVGRNKVTPELLRPEERPLLEYIQGYFNNRRTFGCMPPWELLITRFPALSLDEVVPSSGDITVLADMIHREKLAGTLRVEGLNLSRLAETDPYRALERLQELSYRMAQTHRIGSQDLILSEAAGRVGRELRLVLDSGGLLGIPWIWPALNDATMGIRRGDMIGFYGRPKSMKSHIKVLQGIYAYESGYRVLWVNTEMRKEEVERRVAIAMMRWDYDVRKHPTLELIEQLEDNISALGDMEELEAQMRNTAHQKYFIVTDDCMTPSDLRAKIEELQPDLVIVDTANEMMDDQGAKRDNARQANVCRSLRQITRDERLGKPSVLFSVHANREGEKEIAYGYGEVGGSDQWGKTPDLLLRNVRVKDDQGRWCIAILPPAGGGREVVWDGMVIGAGAYHGMGYIRDTNREDVIEMIKLHRDGAEEDRPRRRRPTRQAVDDTPQEAPVLGATWAE
jgi:hypothetical protein